VTPGCDPNIVTTVSNRGSKVVVIVDAFHYSSALADLILYSTQFGLPAPTPANFQVVFGTPDSVQPPVDPTFGWEFEEALDIEMAHAMAPNAKVILVEAASDSNADLLFAEDVASALVAAAGGGDVSNSWGESEFPGQLALDSHFSRPNVVYFASTGDTPVCLGHRPPRISSRSGGPACLAGPLPALSVGSPAGRKRAGGWAQSFRARLIKTT
jgi:kumamolisin